MKKALQQAEYALSQEEVPVGAVIVWREKIIAKNYNQIEKLADPTAHAEILAITQAASFLKSKWLTGCTMYVTVEPCSMCAGALVLARIKRLVVGVRDPKTGAFGSKLDINRLGLNHKIKLKFGVLEKDCGAILKKFFQDRRRQNFN